MCKTIYKILFLVILFIGSIFSSNLEASYTESCYSGITIKNYKYINSNYKSKVLTIGINYLSKLDKYSDNQKYEKLLQIVIALKKIGVNEGTNNAKSDIINILVDFFECETKILNNKISSNNSLQTSSSSTKWNVKSQGNTICSQVGGGTGTPAKLSTNVCTVGEIVYQRTNCTQADIDTQTIYMWTNYECVSNSSSTNTIVPPVTVTPPVIVTPPVSTSTKWNIKSEGNTVCSQVGGGTGTPAKLSTNVCTIGETVYQRTNCTQADIDTQTIYMWTNYECVSGN